MNIFLQLVSSSIVFCCLLLTGCEKQPELIKGSVFVVTKGAGSYKMGLVAVYLLPRGEAAEVLSRVESSVSEANANLQKDIEAANARIGKLQEEKSSAEEHLMDLEAECKGVDAAYAALNSALDVGNSSDIPDDFRFIFEAKAKADAERNELKTQISGLDGQLSTAGTDINKKKRTASESQTIALKSYYEELRGVETATVAKTGADGEFEIKVPAGFGDCVLAASGTRLTGSEEEEYFWFYRPQFDSDGESTVRLSNDNLAKSLDELKPVLAER